MVSAKLRPTLPTVNSRIRSKKYYKNENFNLALAYHTEFIIFVLQMLVLSWTNITIVYAFRDLCHFQRDVICFCCWYLMMVTCLVRSTSMEDMFDKGQA